MTGPGLSCAHKLLNRPGETQQQVRALPPTNYYLNTTGCLYEPTNYLSTTGCPYEPKIFSFLLI